MKQATVVGFQRTRSWISCELPADDTITIQLRWEMVEKIGIVAAWEPELMFLNHRYASYKTEKIAMWEFNFHIIGENLEVISVISGVGKVNCACCTQLLISQYSPSKLFMTGICGGIGDHVGGGDIIVAERSLQHDVMDAGKGTDALNLYSGRNCIVSSDTTLQDSFKDYVLNKSMSIHFGTVVSGDQRIRSTEVSSILNKTYNAIGVDQEIAAFMHVCFVNQKPSLSLKAVSDKANDSTVEDQKKFKMSACENSCKLLLDYLIQG
jgi:adenosylhomocysteine nucleosidase